MLSCFNFTLLYVTLLFCVTNIIFKLNLRLPDISLELTHCSFIINTLQ